jgi:hypothetical protein
MEVEIQDSFTVEGGYPDTIAGAGIEQLLSNLTEKYVLSLPYGAIVWKEDKLLHEEPGRTITYVGASDAISNFKSFRENCRYPVGMVLKGALEVFNYHAVGKTNIKRRTSNTLLTPGNLFGLFESFGGLHGSWLISSGITSFFLTNSLGDSKFWGEDHVEVRALKHGKDSTYDHSILIDNVGIRTWSSQCLLFDAHSIRSSELKEYFYKKTMEQLVQLVRQNPEYNFCDPEESNWKGEREIARTLDAMIEGYIPVYSLATDQDREYFPYGELCERVRRYLGKAGREDEPIDIWIPCLLGRSRKIGVHFANIGNKFKKDHKQIQKTLLTAIAPLTHKTFVERTEGRSGYFDVNDGSLVWTTKTKNRMVRVKAYQLEKTNPQKQSGNNYNSLKKTHNIKQLITVFDSTRYEINNWPHHLHSALVIELDD